MTKSIAIAELRSRFDINAILAHSMYLRASKENLFEDVAKLLEEKPKPFVKWVGGKRQLLKQFREMGLYPPEGFDPSTHTYYEPFVGGGAVFFDLLPRKAVLSDMNIELVTAYNVIKSDVESLISSLKKHKHDKEYFLAIRAKRVEELTDLEIASRFIYLNRTCFNGLFRVNSKGHFNVPFGKNANPLICDEANLRKVSLALQDVKVLHHDYRSAVKNAKKGDFIYFDPPYHPLTATASFTSYTKENFSSENQKELRDTFLELHKRGCYVMLSNSSADFINEIYSEITSHGITINKVQAGRAINAKGAGRGKIGEVLITNY